MNYLEPDDTAAEFQPDHALADAAELISARPTARRDDAAAQIHQWLAVNRPTQCPAAPKPGPDTEPEPTETDNELTESFSSLPRPRSEPRSNRRGRIPDEDAARTPSGAKSRSRKAVQDATLATGPAQRRVTMLLSCGATDAQAAELALSPLSTHPLGVLRLSGQITRLQMQAGLQLEQAYVALRQQLRQHASLCSGASSGWSGQSAIAGYGDLGCWIDQGHQLPAAPDSDGPTGDDESLDDVDGADVLAARSGGCWMPEAAPPPPPDRPWEISDPMERHLATFAQTEMARATAERKLHGLSPYYLVTAAYTGVEAMLGEDGWRLVVAAVLRDRPPPPNTSLPLLRRALDLIDLGLNPPVSGAIRYYAEPGAQEMPRINRSTKKSGTEPDHPDSIRPASAAAA